MVRQETWSYSTWFGKCSIHYAYNQVFLRRFRDLIQVPRFRENYHRVPKIRENRVLRIREIGSLQIHTGFLTFSLKKKTGITFQFYDVRRFDSTVVIHVLINILSPKLNNQIF